MTASDTNETWRIVLHVDIKAASAQDAIKKAGSLLRPQTELRAKVRHTSVTRADQVETYVPGYLEITANAEDAIKLAGSLLREDQSDTDASE